MVILVLSLAVESLLPVFETASAAPAPATVHNWHALLQHKKRQTDREKQRRGVHGQIVGGKAVPQGRFTFMAFVEIETEFGVFQCGGSLIDPSFVLTAAHCTDDGTGDALPPDAFTTFIGKSNLNDLGLGNQFEVENVFQFPGYVPDEFSPENDVAVLQLADPVPSRIAQPMRIVNSGDTQFDTAGRDSVVAGWGTTFDGGLSGTDQLLEANLKIVSDSSCSASYGSDFVPMVMICAAAPGRDSCQGDSGGPLLAKDIVGHKVKKGKKRKHKKRKKKRVPIIELVQSGIVSWGTGCAQPAFPGVYTRVSAPGINDFIVETMGN